MTPPYGEVKITHGRLNFAGATLDFPPPGVPLFTGVNLTSIGFGFGLDPTRLNGQRPDRRADLVKLDGRLVTAFPSAPPVLPAPTRSAATSPRSSTARRSPARRSAPPPPSSSTCPPSATSTLGHGYFLYEYPTTSRSAAASTSTSSTSSTSAGRSRGGELQRRDAEPARRRPRLPADRRQVCADAASTSHMARTQRAAPAGASTSPGCTSAAAAVGASTDPFIWPFDGCKWSRFKVDVRPRRRPRPRTRTIVVKRGAAEPGAEDLRAGRRSAGAGQRPGRAVPRQHPPAASTLSRRADPHPPLPGRPGDFTVVGLEHARPGPYTVSPLPGSVAIYRPSPAPPTADRSHRAP